MSDKTLNVTSTADAKQKIPDIEVYGNPDAWVLLSKASSESQGWMKSTKAMEIPGVGCIVHTFTQQRDSDGGYEISEASVFVPGTRIIKDQESGYSRLAP